MNTCKQEFLNKGCMCLADPLDPWKTVCGFINRENGLVYPCDPGCCVPKCDGVAHGPRFDQEVRRSTGTDLPPGFGDKLPQSDEPTAIKGAAPVFDPPPYGPGWKTEVPQDRKVWELALSGGLLLILIIISCFALDFWT